MKRHGFISFFLLFLIAASFLSSCSSNTYDNPEIQEPLPTTQNTENQIETKDILNESAEYLIEYGIIEVNKYKADNFLSRLVAVQIILDITGLNKEAENSSYTHPFYDLSGKAEKQISYLYHNNIIYGVTNNYFMEDELCDIDTFLVFLLRALDYIGGKQNDITTENVLETAINKGIIAGTNEDIEDGVLSVNDAFGICYDALYVYIDGSETLLSYLCSKGIARIPDNGDYNKAYEISGAQITPFYEETFNDKKINGYNIENSSGKVYWYGSRVRGTDNDITDSGYLKIAGYEQALTEDQQFSLQKDLMQGIESYGMTFTVNIQSMANEGNEGRVTFRVIPRTADEDFTKYYAINYYMVLPLGNYYSNLVRCKWSITNTNAPTGTQPLIEAYYLLEENIDYTARLLIENTNDGNVHIEFYIDGADRYSTEIEPLLEYTDTSEYKIMQCAAGPAFGNSGYNDSGWGYSSTVLFDDIRLYDKQSFDMQTEQLKEYAGTPVILQEDGHFASQYKYLINNGIIKPYQRNIDFIGNVSVEQFLASAMYLNGDLMSEGQTLNEFVLSTYQKLFKGMETEGQLDLSRSIKRYEAALIISNMMPGDPAATRYSSLYNKLEGNYTNSVYFAVQNSYLLLDENNNFNGEDLLTRQDILRIFSCAVDSRLRDENHFLQIPSVYSDYAILQRDKPIPISGKGMSGDTVTVEFNGQTKSAKVVSGEWYIELDSQPYGGPYNLIIKDSGYTYTFKGIYVGEVFVVAGQSNAEMSVYDSADNRDTLKKFNNQTQVRLFSPASRTATKPYFDTETEWAMARDEFSEHVFGTASAIGVFCVQELLELNPELKKMKIGLIQITYGGTSIEMFEPDCVHEKNGYIQRDDEFIASGFWNGYMDAITPYAVKALIYYQGENSAHLAYMYEPMLRDYIWGVREEFCDPSLPIMLVQLAGYGDNYGQDYDTWPKIREIQMRVANTTDNVGLVTVIDLSDEDPLNIHPTAKRPIGERLAYLAMNMLYDQDYGKTSPTLTGCERSGRVYTLTFDAEQIHINEEAFGDTDFEIMTPKGEWIPAQVKIEGSTLLVWDDKTVVPHGVRYAWANYPKASLFNEDGLPVLPFNTTKDLMTPVSTDEFTSDGQYLKKAYHLLNTGDAVINLTRGNEFRYVILINAYIVEYTGGDIEGQLPGDMIALLKRQEGFICESGTTDTIIKVEGHGLKEGDWIRNTKYDVLTEVLEVIDENTMRVGYIAGQTGGNVFEVFKTTRIVTAEE